MNQIFHFIIFGWPLIALSILITIAGIMDNSAWVVFLGALLIIPFSINLNAVPPFGGIAFFLPVLQIVSAGAVFEDHPVWAWVLFTPTISILIFLTIIGTITSFF